MNELLIIGGASSDVLHLADRTVATAGGAGVYTALAASRCGIRTIMFGPRPTPVPEAMRPVLAHLGDWFGPAVSPEALPQIEIAYRPGQTEYISFLPGAEADLSPEVLPRDLSGYAHVHVTPLGDANQQLDFVKVARRRGARRISAGTYPGDVAHRPGVVRTLIDQSDIFFMNDQEAETLFGSLESVRTDPGKLLYVTLGDRGARIIQGESSSEIPAAPAREVDPTGAGDTFCGATLAHLLWQRHPIMAARHATPMAAEMIGQVGPTALLWDSAPPEVPLDGRVRLDEERIGKVAGRISRLAEAAAFPFVGPEYPPVGYPRVLDYFFAATLQQFSFWSTHHGRYRQPLIAPIGGVARKGSDYLWFAYTRQLQREPDFCSPRRQAELSLDEMRAVFRADDGRDPMPALELHLAQANRYGREMLALRLTPQRILLKALASPWPLRTFVSILDHVGGYQEDPLRKKTGLLAMILNQRPEPFLPLSGEAVEPVIDYHVLRSALRVGLVEVTDPPLQDKLANRQVVSAEEEWAVRFPTYRAMEQVNARSGRSCGAVDHFFFEGRQRCPEMSAPDCRGCPIDDVCAQRCHLFQPVLRTSFY